MCVIREQHKWFLPAVADVNVISQQPKWLDPAVADVAVVKDVEYFESKNTVLCT